MTTSPGAAAGEQATAEPAKKAIKAFRRSHDEAARVVAGLGDDQLRARSGAAEWDVAQVFSHLGSSSELALGILRAGVANREGNQAIWDRWNAMSPSEQAAEFVAMEGRLVAALEALTDEELAGTRLDLRFLPSPVDIARFVEMRLSEVALHRWDADVAFDPRAQLAPYLVPFVLGMLPMYAGYSAKPIGKTGAVAVGTSDPARWYLLELRDDGTSLTELDGPAPDAGTIAQIPAEAFARLAAGRLAPEHTPDGVTVDGAISLDDLRMLFPGI